MQTDYVTPTISQN